MSNFTLIGKRNGMMGIRMNRIHVLHEIVRKKHASRKGQLHNMDVKIVLYKEIYTVYSLCY